MPYSAPAAIAQLPGFRNLLHNGDMRINQRSSVAALSGSNGAFLRPVDRWGVLVAGPTSYTTYQDQANVPSGFKNALLFTNGNATYAMNSGDVAIVNQALEGFDVQSLGYGAGSASNVTLSFWVKVSVSGTYGAAIRINNDAYSYPFSYAASAGTNFQKITVTIPPNLSVLIPADNANRYEVTFSLGCGSTYISAAANTWYPNNYVAPPGCLNLFATAGATWELSGVQLEIGSTATAFEYRPYQYELTLCQRYYFQTVSTTAAGQLVTDFGIAAQTNVAYIPIRFPVPMRAAFGAANTAFSSSAFGTFYATDRIANYDLVSIAGTASSSVHQGDLMIGINAFSMTQRSPIALYSKTTTPAWVAFSAEI